MGGGRAPHPGRPTPRQEAPPPGTLMPPPERAKPARKSARCGIGDESPCPHPPHPQPVGSGPRRHAQINEWSGVKERPIPDAPHPGQRHSPRAPSCRPHSTQSQLARARAVKLVTGRRARIPGNHSKWVVGPGRTPDRTSGQGSESAWARAPQTQARGAPPGRPRAAPTARQASAQDQLARAHVVGFVTGPHARTHPRGAHSPKPGRGKRDRAAPPQASQTEHGTEAGHAEGHRPSRTALPAPSTGTARGARATPTRGGGKGARTPRERERTHTQRTRRENQKGNRTEPAERTGCMEWRTSERG